RGRTARRPARLAVGGPRRGAAGGRRPARLRGRQYRQPRRHAADGRARRRPRAAGRPGAGRARPPDQRRGRAAARGLRLAPAAPARRHRGGPLGLRGRLHRLAGALARGWGRLGGDVSLLAAAASRLGRQDMLQGLTALLAALCLVLAMSWPGGGSVVNESWSVVAPLRATLLAFGALAWGASVGARPRRDEMGPSYVPLPESPPHGEPAWRREVGATLAALLAMGVITMPFDVLSHAASYPRTGLGWSLAAPFLATGGYFGLGL